MTKARSTLRRILPFLAVGLLGAGALAYLKLRPVDAESVIVAAGPVAREARGTGTIESEARVRAAFTVAGRITEIRVREGDTVKVGDVLAVLDASEQDQQVTLAQRSVGSAARAIDLSQASVTRATVELEAAERDRERTDALYAGSAVSKAEWEAARERVARAKADLASAEAARRQSRANVAVAQQSVELQSRRVDDTVLRSTIDGVVALRLREPGDTVSPGVQVLEIVSTKKVWASIWMDETALDSLREGQPARVTLRGSESKPLEARVDRIGMETDRATHELLVDLELLERPMRLVFGQRADATVIFEQHEAASRVPRGACDLEAPRCFVARDGRVTDANVSLGLVGSEWVEVLSGVGPGDRLLLLGNAPEPPVGRRVAGLER